MVLAGVVVLAAWARAAPLAPGSLWLDDLWVVAPSQADSLGDAAEMLVTTPLFTVLVNVPLVFAGPVSWLAQLLPFVAGVLAPVAALCTARTLGLRPAPSVLAAVTTAVAPAHAEYSTRVKQYTVEALLGFVVIGLAWRVLQRRTSPWALAAAGAVVTLVSGSAGVFAGAVLAATLVVAEAPLRRRIVGPMIVFGLFAAGWWALYLRTHVTDSLRDFWREDFIPIDAGVGAFVADVGASLDRLTQGFLPMAPAWPWMVVVIVVVMVRRPVLALVLGAPVGAALLLAIGEAAPIGTGRTDIYLLPSAVIGIAAAADVAMAAIETRGREAAAWVRRTATVAVPTLLVLVLLGTFLARDLRPTEYPAADVRPLIEAAESAGTDDGVIVVYPATRWAYAVYTDGGFDPVPDDNETGFDVAVTTPGVAVLGPHRDEPVRYLPELERATAGADSVTFVASQWRTDLAVIEEWFPANGWVQADRQQRDGALSVEWRRVRPPG